jgi:FtsP/CotA-like multicopper oxidase with cupredoxin domain
MKMRIFLFILFSVWLAGANFSRSLPVPPLASYRIVNGVKVFDMHIRKSTTQFFPPYNTVTYGVNLSVLGETIRIHNGDKVRINWYNHLSEATTMHGHGMHVPARMDGGPRNKIAPGKVWSAVYTVRQSASTNWYHPHLMGKTAEHVYMGLAGFIIVDDNNSDALSLPKQYGVDDIPLVLQDKRFDTSKQIDYSPTRMEIRMGYTSSTLLVNGVITPYVDVEAKKIRFRLLNGSNSSMYRLAFSDGRTFQQIATDGGFLSEPVRVSSLRLSPGERAEIIVDFTNDLGKNIILRELNGNRDFMQIRVSKASNERLNIPSKLATLKKYTISQSVRTRSFILNMTGRGPSAKMAINGKVMDMNRIDEYVPVNDVEIWDITNSMGMNHNFHIHATHFQIISRNGSASNVAANEKGYKDVVFIPPNETVQVIVKMKDYIDDTFGYMYHCHFLEHEDDGMMGQFAVVQNHAAPVADFDGDGIDDISDPDDDNDGVADTQDAFPKDASESSDTDGDGIGDNADMDDDNDGFFDRTEIAEGTDPLDATDLPLHRFIPIIIDDGIMTFVPFND